MTHHLPAEFLCRNSVLAGQGQHSPPSYSLPPARRHAHVPHLFDPLVSGYVLMCRSVVSAVSYYNFTSIFHVNMDAWFRTGSCRKTTSDEGTSTSDSTSSEIVSKSMSSPSCSKIAKKTKTYFRKYNPDFLNADLCFLVLRKSLCLSV